MMAYKGDSLVIKQVNVNLVRRQLQKKESCTMSEIAASTGLSVPTVSSVLSFLLEEGEVITTGKEKSNGGRKAKRYAVNADYAKSILLYITPPHIGYFIVDYKSCQIAEGRRPAEAGTHLEGMMELLETLFQEYDAVKSLVISVPAVLHNGIPYSCSEIPEILGQDLKRLCEERFQVEVSVVRDISAITDGYYEKEMMPSVGSMVYIYFPDFPDVHTPSAGIIVNHQYVNGYSDFAGEIGFLPFFEGAKELEFCSRTDEKQYMDYIVQMVVAVSCVLNPEYVVLNCRRIGEEHLPRLQEACDRYLPSAAHVKLQISKRISPYLFGGLCLRARKMLDEKVNIRII